MRDWWENMIKDPNYMASSPLLKAAFPLISIKDELGEGGQKYVYRAEDQNGTQIALKLIKVAQDPARTLREISAASQFGPPRFPQMLTTGHQQVGTDDVIFLLEELVEGQNLRERLNCGPIPISEAVRIGKELILAVIEVARENLVHRDIKPENILLGVGDRVVLLDFGIARHLLLSSLTQDVAMIGPLTPGYGAPEQVKNEKRGISARTDLFAWAVVMYEMISGNNPFTQNCSTRGEVYQRTLSYDPPVLSACDPKLADTIAWCLKKVAHQRPANPESVYQTIRGL